MGQRLKYAIPWWPGSFPKEGRGHSIQQDSLEDVFASKCQPVGWRVKCLSLLLHCDLSTVMSFALVSVLEKEVLRVRSVGRLLFTQNSLVLFCYLCWGEQQQIIFGFLTPVFSMCSCLWHSGTISLLCEAKVLCAQADIFQPILWKAFFKNHLSEEVFMYCPLSLCLKIHDSCPLVVLLIMGKVYWP